MPLYQSESMFKVVRCKRRVILIFGIPNLHNWNIENQSPLISKHGKGESEEIA